MAPILLWLILVLCLLISVVKYLMGIILRFAFPSTSGFFKTSNVSSQTNCPRSAGQ